MRAKFLRELAAADLPPGPGEQTLVTEADLAALPETVQRYLHFMGVVGRPRDWSFRATFIGRFRPSMKQPWLRCDAWQYNTRLDLARIFHIRIRLGPLPVLARDTYLRGQGRMLVRLLDLITVADGKGPEYDISELVTYLNDGILLAPSMLLAPEVTWATVDDGAFDVTLTDRGHQVTGRVFVDAQGAPTNFRTTDRFYQDPADPKKLVRGEWTTPVEGWQLVNSRRQPTRGRAVWLMPSGELPYADFAFAPGAIVFNVKPGE